MTTLNQFKNCLVFREIDFIFDFYDLNPIVNQLADYIRYIDCISNYTFTSGMLYFKVGDLISKQK